MHMLCSSFLASTLDEYSWLLCPLFPPPLLFYSWMLEPDASVDEDPYYTEGAYYYVQAADDDQE